MALDEATRRFLDQTGALAAPRPHQVGPGPAREGMLVRQLANPPGPEMKRVEDVAIPGPGGVVPARLLTPRGPLRGTIAYLHGGGWVMGTIDGFEGFARRLAEATGCTVAVVDYRLAPEHPHPAATDDAWAALQHLHRQVEAGALPAPLVVAGDSSGGNLAAVVARRAAAEGLPLAAQVLIYPVVDCDLSRPSYLDPQNQLLLDTPTMAWFWDQYVPDNAARTGADASPIRAPVPPGLAPAVVVTAEHDVLRDEGLAYAERLTQAGVTVRSGDFAGQMHAFAGMPHLPASAGALAFIGECLHPLTGPPRPPAS